MAHIQIVSSAACPEGGSFEQERREVLETVMAALSASTPDPDEMAACGYLLRHLARIESTLAA
jgi:hypothetical protein